MEVCGKIHATASWRPGKDLQSPIEEETEESTAGVDILK
jgi:hypothetical protein